jgi:PhnB protein
MYFVVIREQDRAWDNSRGLREQAGWDEHAEFMDNLAAERFVVLAGPVGGGVPPHRAMLIVDTDSENTIRARLADDPWTPMNMLKTVTIDPWEVLIGDPLAGRPVGAGSPRALAYAATAVAPELSVRAGRAAVEFYQEAFGAVEVYRVGGTDQHEAVVSQLSIHGASFWVADESPAHFNFSPETVGGSTTRMLLVVDDPDAVVRRAVRTGAREVRPVSNEHGWRLGRIEDPFGHHWEIGRPLIPWPPARR